MLLVERRASPPGHRNAGPFDFPLGFARASATQGQARETPVAPFPKGLCPIVTCLSFRICPIVAIKQRGYVRTVKSAIIGILRHS